MSENKEATQFLTGQSPIQVVEQWLTEAKNSHRLKEANAMVVSTVNENNEPTSRVVLCKEITADSILFYTNYNSEKGHDLAQNKKVAINFFWDYAHKQIKINGTANKTSREKSVEYWDSRPRDSQISQYLSAQSMPVDSRQIMTDLHLETLLKFKDKPVPCPEHWGGYEVKIEKVEFWIGRENRFHDRFSYIKVQDKWLGCRLFP
jgi:pyridoxamine 5'-phosphate oxidase